MTSEALTLCSKLNDQTLILTHDVSLTFETWAQKVIQKTDWTYSDSQDQIDYTCVWVEEWAEAYLTSQVCVDTSMFFHSCDKVLKFLCEIMFDSNSHQTVWHKLNALNQGKMKFAKFYDQFITQIIDLNYSE